MNPTLLRPRGRRPTLRQHVDELRVQMRSLDYDLAELDRRQWDTWYRRQLVTDLAELRAGALWLEDQLNSKQAA